MPLAETYVRLCYGPTDRYRITRRKALFGGAGDDAQYGTVRVRYVIGTQLGDELWRYHVDRGRVSGGLQQSAKQEALIDEFGKLLHGQESAWEIVSIGFTPQGVQFDLIEPVVESAGQLEQTVLKGVLPEAEQAEAPARPSATQNYNSAQVFLKPDRSELKLLVEVEFHKEAVWSWERYEITLHDYQQVDVRQFAPLAGAESLIDRPGEWERLYCTRVWSLRPLKGHPLIGAPLLSDDFYQAEITNLY